MLFHVVPSGQFWDRFSYLKYLVMNVPNARIYCQNFLIFTVKDNFMKNWGPNSKLTTWSKIVEVISFLFISVLHIQLQYSDRARGFYISSSAADATQPVTWPITQVVFLSTGNPPSHHSALWGMLKGLNSVTPILGSIYINIHEH